METDLQKIVYLNTYSRWIPEKNRRETWEETVHRVMDFFRSTVAKKNFEVTHMEWQELTNAMMEMEVMPSMRVVQMAGPALERCNVGAYNCAYLPLKDPRSFAELLYILMQGTGVGFSVEQQYVDMWPIVTVQTGAPRLELEIEDSTEGWCDALRVGIEQWMNGFDVVFDYSRIRPYGAPLKTKGGKASGPEPLKNLLDFARTLILRHQGRKLSSINFHDLACYCGSIVQVGGVRRAAEISLSDLDDHKMRDAKVGDFYNRTPERAMANNSAVYSEKPSMEDFMSEWMGLMKSGTGERGIFNRAGLVKQMPSRRDRDDWTKEPIQFGVNPCGEIVLRPYEFCNLSIAVARPNDTLDSLKEKVRLATKFGIIQSLLTDFKYIRSDWKENCEEERLLGVDITGQMDCKVFTDPLSNRMAYSVLQETSRSAALSLSKRFGINMPAALTCVKPSGNSSQLLNVSSGLHPRYAPYYIRRLRIGASSPVSDLLISSGVPHHPEVGQPPDSPTVWVFEFPVASPQGAVTRHSVNALQQLEHWKIVKVNFTEHNPSITVYVKEHEWLEVGAWVYKNWDIVGGISFLPFDGGSYVLAPYEEITAQQYEALVKAWPKIDFSKLQAFEKGDTTTVSRDYACTGDKCEL